MIHTLIILACLATEPTDCRTYEQPVAGLSALPTAAYVQSQAIVAAWLGRHPGLVLRAFQVLPGRGA
jgi:hypothetical protein